MCALYHKNRAVFKLQGPDALSFLQGIITNDSETLAENSILYTVMLTPTGRFPFEFFLYWGHEDGKDCVYLDTPASFASDLFKRMRLFKLRANVTIDDISDKVHVVTYHDDSPPSKRFAFPDPRHPSLGYRGLFFEGITKDYQDDEVFYTDLCLKLCIPRAGFELIPEKTIPLEANLEELNALSFTKGCYLGQELTARTKHQGTVRKKLYPVLIDGQINNEMLEKGITIYDDARKIGVLLSHEKGLGIAKLRIDDVEKKQDQVKVWQGILTETKTDCCKITYSPDKAPPK